MFLVFSTVFRFSVQGPDGTIPGPKLAHLLRNQLLREKTDFLLFKVLRVDTVSKWLFPFDFTKSENSHIINKKVDNAVFLILPRLCIFQCVCCCVLDVVSVIPLQRAVPVTLSGWRTPFTASLMMARAIAVSVISLSPNKFSHVNQKFQIRLMQRYTTDNDRFYPWNFNTPLLMLYVLLNNLRILLMVCHEIIIMFYSDGKAEG